MVWAAIHGEEAVTLQAAHQLLRTVHADDACAVVVPVLNPDGVLAGTRQNARGVDLNRNFPGANWSPVASPTFWSTSMTRTSERRTLLSSPGDAPGSEPEVQALMALVQRVQPELVIDLHTPLECLIATSERARPVAQHLAEPTGIRIIDSVDGPTPGDSSTWMEAQGVTAVTYEFELVAFPLLWHRHGEALTRCIVERR
ncbi:MAG: murein peptide amidase [Thermoleophilia bacterium]|nr:murein peptide amidase [Thermoleophilia bacterium]